MSRYKDKDLLKQRQEQAYKYFIDKGYSPAQSSGIVGNLMQESRLNPGVKSTFKGEGSFGIAQWNPGKAAGNRFGKLREFAKQKGGHHADFNIQLDFIHHELNNTRYLGKDKLMNAKTAEEASEIFSKYYERPNAKYAHNDKRANYAKSVYAMFNDKDTYSKDEKGQIVVLNPEVVTEEDKIKSPAIKREFYLEVYDIPQEKEVNVEAPPAVTKAKQDIEQTQKEVAFKNQLGDALKQLDKRAQPTPTRQQPRQQPQQQQFEIGQNEFYQAIMPQMEIGGKTDPKDERAAAQKKASSTNVSMPKIKNFSNLNPGSEINISLDDIMNGEETVEDTTDPVVDKILANADFKTKNSLREIPTPAYGGVNINLNNSVNKRSFRVGDAGGDVQQIQQFLINQGYMDSTTVRGNSNADGKFGAITARALKKFQQAKGLQADGYLGKNTLKAIENTRDRKVVDERSMNIKVQDNTAVASSLYKEFIPKVKKQTTPAVEGEAEGAVEGLQNIMSNQLGIDTKGVDGKWGKNTQAAFDELKEYVESDKQWKYKPSIMKSIEAVAGFQGGNMTEENFDDSELDLMRKLAVRDGKIQKSFSYDDVRAGSSLEGKEVTDYGDNIGDVVESFDAVSLNLVLGSAGIVKAPDGNVYVYDVYDFNDVGDYETDKRTPEQVYEDRMKYVAEKGDDKGFKGIYSKARARASKEQRKAQIEAAEQGKQWRPSVSLINLGKADELLKKYGS